MLEIRRFVVHKVSLADQTAFDEEHLTIDACALQEILIAEDARIKAVNVGLASPGEETRMVCVKDVIEPRVKTTGGRVGEGVVHVLKNIAVVTCGPIVGFQEGIIDMNGPGAAHTPFSSMLLVVLQIEVVDGITAHQHEEIVRKNGLWAAEYLCQATVQARPDKVEHVAGNQSPEDESLPRIAYVYMVLSQGLLHDTYVLGHDAKQGLPRIIDPAVLMEGGIVSGNCVSACDKNTTYHHQNNPLLRQLLDGHGVHWNFVGVVVTNEPVRLGEKQNSARDAIELVKQLKADGVIISKEGFGNPDADLMLIVRGLQQAGIQTVAITDEFAGVDGSSQSLADATPEADAIVSVGNANEPIVLPVMQTTIGPLPDVSRLAGGYPHSIRADGTIEVELQAIIGATNQLGFGRLSCREI